MYIRFQVGLMITWLTHTCAGSSAMKRMVPPRSCGCSMRARSCALGGTGPNGTAGGQGGTGQGGAVLMTGGSGTFVDDTFLDFSTAQVWTGPLDGGAAGGHGAGLGQGEVASWCAHFIGEVHGVEGERVVLGRAS